MIYLICYFLFIIYAAMKSQTLGILCMLGHALAMSLYYILSKKLTGYLAPSQVTFCFKFCNLLLLMPLCLTYGRKQISTARVVTHFIRALFAFMGTLCFLYAVQSGIVLSNITTITFLEHTLILLIGIIYFKDRMTYHKALCLLLSICGMIIIVKPTSDTYQHGYLYILFALLFWAGSNTAIKILGKTERSITQLFYINLFSSMLACPMAINHWNDVAVESYKYIFGLSLCNLTHTYMYFKSLKLAETTLVIPFDYTRIIFVGILGYWIYDEVINTSDIYGYVMITLSGVILILNKHK